MDKQRLIEFTESLDDISGTIHYEHRLNSSLVSLLRHCVDSADDFCFRAVNQLDIDNGFSAIESYNESIKRSLEELENVIASLYRFANGHESTDTDDGQLPLWDDDGEISVALQDPSGIEIVSSLSEEDYIPVRQSSASVTIKRNEDDWK
jgi:hypothetical protein